MQWGKDEITLQKWNGSRYGNTYSLLMETGSMRLRVQGDMRWDDRMIADTHTARALQLPPNFHLAVKWSSSCLIAVFCLTGHTRLHTMLIKRPDTYATCWSINVIE